MLAATLLLAVGGAIPWQNANAERLLTENFDYTPGDLYQQGGWMKAGTDANSPIQILPQALEYAGYPTDGGKVELGQTKTAQDLFRAFDVDKTISSGTAYVSFLINVKDLGAKDNKAYFFAFVPETAKGLSDGSTVSSEFVKIFALPSANEGKFNLAFAANGNCTKADVNRSRDLDLNTTYLVVLSLTFVDGNNNDIIKMWVNPVISKNEPAADVTRDPNTDNGGDMSVTSGGFKYVELRQGQTASIDAPLVEIDGLHVADSWADLFDEIPEVKTPLLTSSVATYRFGAGYVGTPFSFTSLIAGENLKGDITFTLPSDITASPASISAEEAAEGVEVTFTVTPAAADFNYDHVITISSPEAEDYTINVVGEIYQITDVSNATKVYQLAQDSNNEGELFRYTGKAVVTAITTETGNYGIETMVYMQDIIGGMKMGSMVFDLSESDLAVGDEITNVTFMLLDINKNTPVMYPLQTQADKPFYERTATGKTKTPVEVSPGEITATTAPSYLYRLVQVKDVTFTEADGTKAFATAVTPISDGEHTAQAVVMNSSGLIGQPIPQGTVTLTGISRYHDKLGVYLRSADDIIAGAPEMSVTAETIFKEVAAPVGESTPLVKFTVVAENLPAPAPILFGGANAALFSSDLTEIPAGSGTHVVTVSVKPETTGSFSANFMIDADAISSEFNYSRKVEVKAYDPENLPAITITPATLNLEAKPGETVTATVKLNSSGCFDYITGKASVMTGVLLINNTFMPANSNDVELTVTFKPTAEGTFTETWTYTTSMCETPATLTVTAVCEGERPQEPTQGDEFKVSDANPLIAYTQDFASVESNQPLKLEGWTNVAVEGTRAWWGYVSTDADDPFHAAKVTAYDSAIAPEDAEPVEMLLISPALNYKDAADRNLTFKLMGMYLAEGQLSKLDVMLGEPNGTDRPDFYVMDGFEIPATADEAGEWIPYTVDMSLVPDMPDTFFIAFRFTSERSRAEAATYYVTDFVWNPTATGIEAIAADGLYTVFNLQGIRVLKDADAAAVKSLPAGLYIVNGRKTMIK